MQELLIFLSCAFDIHIDFFLIDRKRLPLISDCEYQTKAISDHAPLLITLYVPTSKVSKCQQNFASSDVAKQRALCKENLIYYTHKMQRTLPIKCIIRLINMARRMGNS